MNVDQARARRPTAMQSTASDDGDGRRHMGPWRRSREVEKPKKLTQFERHQQLRVEADGVVEYLQKHVDALITTHGRIDNDKPVPVARALSRARDMIEALKAELRTAK